MARYTIGRILPIFKGDWDNNESYDKLDIVLKEISSYVSLIDNNTTEPTDQNNNWKLVCRGATPEEVMVLATPVILEMVDERTLDVELAFKYDLMYSESTPSGGEWLLPKLDLAPGDEIVILWETQLNNHISFATSDSEYTQVNQIENITSTESTTGTIRYTAPVATLTMRIFSEYSVLSVKIYKKSDTDVINDIYDKIDDIESLARQDKAELEYQILDINNDLYNTLIESSTTTEPQNWILVQCPLEPNDSILFTWETPLSNDFSIEAGDSEYAFTFNIYHKDNTTETKGSYTYTATTSSSTLRIYSKLANFTMNIYRISDTSKIDKALSQFGVVTISPETSTDGLINSLDGTKNTSLSWYGDNCSFDVKVGQKVSFYQAPLEYPYGYAFYNGNTYISGGFNDLSQVEQISVVVPENATKMALSWNRNHIPKQQITIDNSLDNLRTRLSNVEESIQDLQQYMPYKGKKILSLGDSYTMMNYYGNYLEEVTGCELTPRGYNGENLRHFTKDTYQNTDNWAEDVTLPLTSEYLKGFDIITVMGGTNDYGQGYIAGTLSDDKDADSVAGHAKWLIEELYRLNPDAKIYFCTQPYRVPHPAFHNGLGGHLPNIQGSTLEDCMNTVVEVCKYYSIPVFDFYHLSGWNEYTNRVTNPEAGQPSASNVYAPFDGNHKTIDGLHPRNGEGNGAQQLGYQFGKFINLN